MSTRGTWFMRDRPLVCWLALAAIVSLVHPFVPASRWLMVHLVSLGAVTHAVMVWSIHFTDALLRVPADIESRRRKTARLGLLQAGVLLVVAGVPTTWWLLTLLGATLVVSAVTWHGYELTRRLRGAVPGRLRVTVRHYLLAATCLPVGATLGVLLARGLGEAWHGRLLVAHSMVNLLGFVGLTVLGTLVTLWPTMLRTRMAPQAERDSRRALPLLGIGVAAAVSGPLLDVRWLLVAGLAGYAFGAALVAVDMVRAARVRPPVTFSTLSAGAAVAWLLIGLAMLGLEVARQPSWGELAANYGLVTVVFVVGFALQVLLGALTYLIPVVVGGGPSVLRVAMAEIGRWGAVRATVTNAGLAICLLPVPSLVRVIVSVLVLVALVVFMPLLLRGIRAAVAARRAVAQAPVAGGQTAARHTGVHGTAAETAAARQPRRTSHAGANEAVRTPTLSRLQLLTGMGTVAAGAALGVAMDPAAAGLARSTAGSGAVTPTGRTTRVQVTAQGMRFVPASIEVPAGDRLVIDLHNADPGNIHDLVFGNGATSGRLSPRGRASLDAGVVGGDLEGWCSVVGHRQMGMVMQVRAIGGVTGAASGRHSGHAGTTPAGEAPALDAGRVPPAGFSAYDAVLAPVPATGRTHRITLTVTEVEQEVATGVRQRRWTFNGTGPGPVLHGRIGDTFEITLVNDGSMGHSIDFHAGRVRPDEVMRTIPPGQRLEYRFVAERAGIWMYHCSTPPMSAHIAAGMHGAVIVEPDDLEAADRNYVLVQSEVFLGAQSAPVAVEKVVAERPDAVVFNGYAWQYVHRPLVAKVGERVRIWVLDAGPNRPTSFHVIGGQFDTVWSEGAYLLRRGRGALGGADGGSQALGLQAAQGGFVELVFDDAGHYPFVSHVMIDAERGAKGLIAVT